MTIVPLGRINCGASATQVFATKKRVQRVTFAPIVGTTGRMAVGVSGMDMTTRVGVIKEFAIPVAGAGFLDIFVIEAEEANPIDLSTLYVHGTVSGEGLLVTYQVQ